MNRKRLTLVLAGALLLLSLWALAGALGGLTFREGRLPAPAFGPGGSPPAAAPPSAPDWIRVAFRILIWVLLPASIVMLVLNPRSLKLVLLRALAVSAWVLALWALLQFMPRFGFFDPGAPAEDDPGGALRPADPLPDVGAVPLPWWSGWLAAFLLIGLALWLIWRARRAWLLLRPEDEDELPGRLARAAGAAARELEGGTPLREVVVRCYARMCELLGARQPGHLPVLTPREFEVRLQRAGVSDPSVVRLSRLFERVRYGQGSASAEEEREALACLARIEHRYRGPT